MNPFDIYNSTVLNPYALIILIVSSISILFVKKIYMIVPAVIVCCFITQMQRIVIFGIDFPFMRIILIVGLIRLLLSNAQSSITFNKIDKLFIYWIIIRTITHTLLWLSPRAFIYISGQNLDILGSYFFVRLIISDFKSYDVIIKTLLVASIPVALFMTIEQMTGGRNYFSLFGGVAEFNTIREEKLRAQGAFTHAILAGTFGALLLPFAWGIWQRKKRLIAITGFLCAVIITFASSSSGPVVTLGIGIFGIFFWKFNQYTKKTRNLFFFTLIFLHLVMSAPVWHLISRIDLVGGSTGYHRYLIIDAAVNNFFRWFLLGFKNPGAWGLGLEDITNQYIGEGVTGGIIPLIFFILIIINCFRTIGLVRSKFEEQPDIQKYIWSLGCILFAHTITFLSISYFGQIVFIFYMHIAMISSLNNLQETMLIRDS